MSAYTIKRVSSAPKAEPLRSVERKHISRAKHPEQNKEQKRRQRENNPRPFVGVDGEGGTTGPCMDELCHAFRACRAYTEVTPATETVPATCSCEHPVSEHRHEYWLLRAGENVLETGQPLTTAKCLAFLADLDPGPLYVGYFFGYDVWQIVADLPPAKLARLNDRKSRTPKSGGREPWPVDVTFGPCGLCECAEWWFDRTEYVVKRSLPKNIDGDAAAIWDALSATKSLPLDPLSDEQVWDHLNDAHRKPLSDGASKGTGRLVAVCECGHASSSHRDNFLIDYLPGNFFKVRRADAGYKWIEVSETGSFFQQSFLKTLNDWEIGTVSEREQIRAGKERRQGFGKPDDEERFYNALEVRLMSELMELLRQTLKECGLPMPRKWQGPGKIAEALLKQHGIPKKEELPFWNDETFKRDMNATYYGGWFELTAVGDVATYELYGFDIGSAYPYALTKVPCLEHGTWTKSDRPTSDLYIAFGVFEAIEDALVYGFSFRSKTGAISHPKNGSGWYWSFEIEASIHQRFTIQRCWSYHQQCGCQPFYWIPALYEQRRRIGKGLKGKVIKLALNSLYGKLCQRVGRAAYNNLVWASFITAHCRTQLQTFIHSLPGCREGGRECADDVWKLATDGIIASTVPMVMPPDPLTPGLAALLRDHGQDRPGSQSGGRRRHGYVSSKRTFRNLGRACGRRRGLHAAGLVMACTFGR